MLRRLYKRLPLAHLPNAWLLFALLTLVLAYPFLARLPYGHAALVVFDVAILLLALRAARAGGNETSLGYVLLALSLILHPLATFWPGNATLIAGSLAQAVFHGFIVVCLFRYMLQDEVMTVDELFGSATLYVLMAFVFAYLYVIVETLQPGSFVINAANNPDGHVDWWDLLYFSFTCLTSVGFGEITPAGAHARSVVMIEQMLGVLYLALVISRLISLQRQRGQRGGN